MTLSTRPMKYVLVYFLIWLRVTWSFYVRPLNSSYLVLTYTVEDTTMSTVPLPNTIMLFSLQVH